MSRPIKTITQSMSAIQNKVQGSVDWIVALPLRAKLGCSCKAGTPNKRTQELQEKLCEPGCDPIKGMVGIANSSQAEGNLMLAGQMYKELAQYLYPKRKATEIVAEQDDEMVKSVTIRMVDARK